MKIMIKILLYPPFYLRTMGFLDRKIVSPASIFLRVQIRLVCPRIRGKKNHPLAYPLVRFVDRDSRIFPGHRDATSLESGRLVVSLFIHLAHYAGFPLGCRRAICHCVQIIVDVQRWVYPAVAFVLAHQSGSYGGPVLGAHRTCTYKTKT